MLSVEVPREDLRKRKQQLDSQLQALSQERVSLMKELEKLSNLSLAETMVKSTNRFPTGGEGGDCSVGSPICFSPNPLASRTHLKGDSTLRVSRQHRATDTVIRVGKRGIPLGCAGEPQIIAGPCAVETEEQIFAVAAALEVHHVHFLRGGAFKPRTSPYDFQGLGEKGWSLLRQAADAHGLCVVSEVMCPYDLEAALHYVDVVQVGSRNMHNYALLKLLGEIRNPVLLKRGMAATLQEWLLAAEYIVARGNHQVVLCERGIRTYETSTRNTLDIAAIPLLKQASHLPVVVDVAHATGCPDIFLPCSRAALAAGADGIMLEVHPVPADACSDAQQQIDLPHFASFVKALQMGWTGPYGEGKEAHDHI
ncbi:bifunctional 3-deoxy-7-phosphoheptulonate synthase/chorismate mutase [Pasteuria penetrans]|uniref:bifunctional 3-deoxy-7-phosphoheptulonate synthase/chorismate mutase n=1 Tax=Pasteuria penetrans TaxID=86005 RepID=UPI001FE533E7|nr:bifunctional 3-deoxy-7-phosphoheptulonate synthase/chorismate mutase [Pasteuria penetrans]